MERAVGPGGGDRDEVRNGRGTIHTLGGDLVWALPLISDSTTIRPCTRADLELLASWPRYPRPYQAFDFSFRSLGPAERDRFFVDWVQGDDRITLVCDRGSEAAIGYIALLRIDWHSRAARSMSLRVHADWCGRGIGTQMLQLVSEWWFGCDMQTLRLDVAASNQRAVRCYRKAGFAQRGELWREAPDLQSVDLEQAQYDFLQAHVRFSGPVPEIRFLWMCRTVQDAQPAPCGETHHRIGGNGP